MAEPVTVKLPPIVEEALEMNPSCRYESPVVVAPEFTKKSPSIVEEALEISPPVV